MSTSFLTRLLPVALLAMAVLLLPTDASAVLIGGIDFPQGPVSFADVVAGYNPLFGGGPAPTASNSDPSNALGVPEVPGNTSIGACTGVPSDCPFVSLGNGGTLTLRFTNNVLTGSDNADLDLWIFEVGPDIEDTFVEVSADGTTWIGVGKVFGTTGGIDIDAYGFTSADMLEYVRLRDDPNEGSTSGASVGADIDAVGAITTIRVGTTPEPASTGLLVVGIAAIGAARRRRRRT